jgi:hypothetical protein
MADDADKPAKKVGIKKPKKGESSMNLLSGVGGGKGKNKNFDKSFKDLK